MFNYQEKLYALIKKQWYTNAKVAQESYASIEQTFLDRWLTELIAKLSLENQQSVADKLQAWWTPWQLYEFLDATLDDIDALNTQILDEFIVEYKTLMGM